MDRKKIKYSADADYELAKFWLCAADEEHGYAYKLLEFRRESPEMDEFLRELLRERAWHYSHEIVRFYVRFHYRGADPADRYEVLQEVVFENYDPDDAKAWTKALRADHTNMPYDHFKAALFSMLGGECKATVADIAGCCFHVRCAYWFPLALAGDF